MPAASDYCDMKYIHYVEKPVVANKMIFEQEKKTNFEQDIFENN